MAIEGVSLSLQVAISQYKQQVKTDQATSQSSSAQRLDTVALRDKNFAFRLYGQASLSQIANMVNVAAEEIGVDLNTFDASPESTADLISGFAISMYSVYRKQNPDMGEEEALAEYGKMIHGAIDKGFTEALQILQGLNVKDEGVMTGIQKTYDLIQEKLGNFFAAKRAELGIEQEATALP